MFQLFDLHGKIYYGGFINHAPSIGRWFFFRYFYFQKLEKLQMLFVIMNNIFISENAVDFYGFRFF